MTWLKELGSPGVDLASNSACHVYYIIVTVLIVISIIILALFPSKK